MDWQKRLGVILSIAISLYKMSQYFPEPYEPISGGISVEVDLTNHATKSDIKNISHVDASSFTLKTV